MKITSAASSFEVGPDWTSEDEMLANQITDIIEDTIKIGSTEYNKGDAMRCCETYIGKTLNIHLHFLSLSLSLSHPYTCIHMCTHTHMCVCVHVKATRNPILSSGLESEKIYEEIKLCTWVHADFWICFMLPILLRCYWMPLLMLNAT